ncbi:MAG: GDSL-type esterase/lipase family protein, partial [Phycisphaerae bacterium]
TQTVPIHQPTSSHPPEIYVLGDSLSAGLGGQTWPKLYEQRYGTKVINLAKAGATAADMIAPARTIPSDPEQLVIVEIGGNDLLGGRTAAAYGADLLTILDLLKGHRVVLLEIPLIPLCEEFGRQQRRAVRDHPVIWVPKRHFAAVLTGSDATSDGLHLSPTGASRMADLIHTVIKDGT